MTLSQRLASHAARASQASGSNHMNTKTPWPRLPECATPRIGAWPPGTSTGAC